MKILSEKIYDNPINDSWDYVFWKHSGFYVVWDNWFEESWEIVRRQVLHQLGGGDND